MPAGLLAAFVSQAAPGDLIGRDATQRALLEANPVLDRIARERLEALGPILDRLRAPRPGEPRAPERGEAPDGAQGGLLAENPALADCYRDSPKRPSTCRASSARRRRRSMTKEEYEE